MKQHVGVLTYTCILYFLQCNLFCILISSHETVPLSLTACTEWQWFSGFPCGLMSLVAKCNQGLWICKRYEKCKRIWVAFIRCDRWHETSQSHQLRIKPPCSAVLLHSSNGLLPCNVSTHVSAIAQSQWACMWVWSCTFSGVHPPVIFHLSSLRRTFQSRGLVLGWLSSKQEYC